MGSTPATGHTGQAGNYFRRCVVLCRRPVSPGESYNLARQIPYPFPVQEEHYLDASSGLLSGRSLLNGEEGLWGWR